MSEIWTDFMDNELITVNVENFTSINNLEIICWNDEDLKREVFDLVLPYYFEGVNSFDKLKELYEKIEQVKLDEKGIFSFEIGGQTFNVRVNILAENSPKILNFNS